MLQKTYRPARADVKHEWYVVDAKDKVLGRLSSRVAMILRGKHKPSWCLDVDQGDYVIIINASAIRVTGQKPIQKLYRWNTGFPEGFRERQFRTQLATRPHRVIEHAVHHMLPKNLLGMKQRHRLFVYPGADHPHQAQQPKLVNL